MQYIHIKKLEEYNPGYQDRSLIWCKSYFKMINADPEFEMLCEIDKWRFIAFVMLELQIKKPVPLDETYLSRKGFNFKQRKLAATLADLSQSIETTNVTQDLEIRNDSVTQSRVEKSRVEKSRCAFDFELLWTKYPKKLGRENARLKFISQIKTEEDYANINKALDNFLGSEQGQGDPKFIPHGSTWFNERWRDYIDYKPPEKSKVDENGIPLEWRTKK